MVSSDINGTVDTVSKRLHSQGPCYLLLTALLFWRRLVVTCLFCCCFLVVVFVCLLFCFVLLLVVFFGFFGGLLLILLFTDVCDNSLRLMSGWYHTQWYQRDAEHFRRYPPPQNSITGPCSSDWLLTILCRRCSWTVSLPMEKGCTSGTSHTTEPKMKDYPVVMVLKTGCRWSLLGSFARTFGWGFTEGGLDTSVGVGFRKEFPGNTMVYCCRTAVFKLP